MLSRNSEHGGIYMADEIGTRVAADLHPGVVTGLDSYDDDTATNLAPTVTAFTGAYRGNRKGALLPSIESGE